MWWLALACGPSWDELTAPDSRTRARAISELPAWRARQMVPLLEKWALQSVEGRAAVANASLRALVAADTPESCAFVADLARSEQGHDAVRALAAVPTRCARDHLAELCSPSGRWHGRHEACRPPAEAP